jgi:hypothetical protein
MDNTFIESLRHGRKCLVNVGLVGQPRDRDERSCYAIYRRDTQDILWRRSSHDIIGAQQAIIDASLPVYFAQRLQLGKLVGFTETQSSSASAQISPPECFALAFFAFAITRSNIPCVTFQRSGFGSVLPA